MKSRLSVKKYLKKKTHNTISNEKLLQIEKRRKNMKHDPNKEESQIKEKVWEMTETMELAENF